MRAPTSFHPPGRSLVLAVVLLALPACAERRPLAEALAPPGPEAMATARDDYEQACAACHGRDARGAGPEAARLDPPPSDLTLLAARNDGVFPTDAVIATIAGERDIPAHGPRAMPIWRTRFGADEPGAAVATIATRRRFELIARHLATLQRARPTH